MLKQDFDETTNRQELDGAGDVDGDDNRHKVTLPSELLSMTRDGSSDPCKGKLAKDALAQYEIAEAFRRISKHHGLLVRTRRAHPGH